MGLHRLGPTYAGFEDAGWTAGSPRADAAMATVPLVILKADALEDTLSRVEPQEARSPHRSSISRAAGGSTSADLRPGTNSALVAASVDHVCTHFAMLLQPAELGDDGAGVEPDLLA